MNIEEPQRDDGSSGRNRKTAESMGRAEAVRKMETSEKAAPAEMAEAAEMTEHEIRLEHILPADIEKRSFEIIRQELDDRGIVLDPEKAAVIMRCIHTSADFDYAESLCFSEDVMDLADEALRSGADIVTDTQMARAGISKRTLSSFGGEVFCFMSDEDVALDARKRGVTRAIASMDKAARLAAERGEDLIYAIGNAPTALIHLTEQIRSGKVRPRLVIGVPVGFVNVVQAKEMLMETDVPFIVARGRKGGSNIAACIVNALLYRLKDRRASELISR